MTSADARSSVAVARPTASMDAMTSSSVIGSSVSTSARHPKMLECLVHLADVHRADRAQVLGHDEIGIHGAQRALVERVEILAGRQPGPHRGVDLHRSEALGQRRVRDDAALPSFGWEVALEGHAHHVGAGAHGEEDLRGGREQGNDAHADAR